MFKRRLLALVAGLIMGLPGMSMATMLPDSLENTPSSFALKTTRSDITSEWLENKATIALARKTGIFSRYKFPGVSFENAASVGLSAARPETRSQSIEQMVAAASLRHGIFGLSGRSAGEEPNLPSASTRSDGIQTSGASLRDVAKVLVNKPVPGATQRQGSGARNQGGGSFVDAILGTQLEDAFIDAATNVVTPTIQPDGVVALNFMGLRDFAFMVSPVTNKIEVLDFKTGTTLTISHSPYENTGSMDGEMQQHRPGRSTHSNSFNDHRIIQFLRSAASFTSDFLLHPITFASLLIISLFWGILSISRRSA